jgi:hypothetical protein
MKFLSLFLLPLLCAGCLTADDMIALSNAATTSGRPQPGYRPTMTNQQSFNQAAYTDGYRRGYRAGFNDSSNGLGYRAAANYGSNPAFASGFYKGYDEGFYEARRGMAYGCSL